MTQLRIDFSSCFKKGHRYVAKRIGPEETARRARARKERRDLGTGWIKQSVLDKYYLDNYGIDRAAERAKTIRKIQSKSKGIDFLDEIESIDSE